MKSTILLCCLLTVLLLTLAACGNERIEIKFFEFTPQFICSASNTTARWDSSNGKNASIATTPEIVPNPRDVPPDGEEIFFVEQDTNFILTVSDSDGNSVTDEGSVILIPEGGYLWTLDAALECNDDVVGWKQINVPTGLFDSRASITSVSNTSDINDLIVDHNGTTVTLQSQETTSALNGDPHGTWNLSVSVAVPRCEGDNNVPPNLFVVVSIICNQ